MEGSLEVLPEFHLELVAEESVVHLGLPVASETTADLDDPVAIAPAAAYPSMKWHGGVQLVIEAPLARVWEIASETCGVPLWMPMIESCEKLDGEENSPGCRRLIRGDILPRIDGIQSWAIENLVEFDQDYCFYSYAMEDSNIGMQGYVATLQLNDYGDGTTLVSWFYEVDPMPDSCEEVMADYMSMFFKACIKRLECLSQESEPITESEAMTANRLKQSQEAD